MRIRAEEVLKMNDSEEVGHHEDLLTVESHIHGQGCPSALMDAVAGASSVGLEEVEVAEGNNPVRDVRILLGLHKDTG